MGEPSSRSESAAENFPSLGRNSLALFVGEAAKVGLGFITAVVTSRVLGPEGKGTLSTLLFIGALLSYGCTMGLGDSATVLVARGRYTLQEATSASFLPVLASSLIGIGCLWVVVPIAGWHRILPVVAAASVLLPIAVYARLTTSLLNVREHIAFTSFVSASSATVTATLLVLLLVVLEWDLFGAMVANVAGSLFALVSLAWFLNRRGVSLKPRIVPDYVTSALRFGWLVEFSYLLVAMSQRLDLLIVYALLGEGPAGRYSIALTLSQLSAYASFALIMASFPRLAHLGEERFMPLLLQLFRISLLTGVIAAVALAVVLPQIVRPLFGAAFTGAIGPALLLLPAAIIGSQQWLLARAAVSIGRNRLYPGSFACSVAVLVLLDYILVPRYGLIGAAAAAVCSSSAGLAICLMWFRRYFGLRAKELVPARGDIVTLRRVVAGIVPSRGGGA